ncbi:MAG TPA: Uma2 family endonuclease [Bryobacteraceae bacterium]|nr:Uma2 family endonuclease [Bryobacteraceae bacterium]
MASAHLVSVDEYLHSTFEVDAEYVEGRIVPRPIPQKDHSKVQTWLVRNLYPIAHPQGFEVWVEQRIRTKVSPDRYRIPDLCLTPGEPDEQVFTDPPFLCIEILSPEDAALDVREKIREYLNCGVAWVWIIDPSTLSGEIHSDDSIVRVTDGTFRAGDITLDLRRM